MKLFVLTKVYADMVDLPSLAAMSGIPEDEYLLFYAGVFTVIAVIAAVILLRKVNK